LPVLFFSSGGWKHAHARRDHGLTIADAAKGFFDGRHHIGHTDIETLGIGV
jgi:hypothetical protein